jgi:lysozyme
MQVSQKAIRLISHFEGRANYAYTDPVGVCTVGVGHALTPHRRCTSADFERYGWRGDPRMSDDHVDRILRRDLARFEEGVTKLVRRDTLQREFDAMVCLAFNIGLGGFQGSTVLRMHNARRSYLAGLAFMRWVFGGGVVLPGLVRRRRSERYLYRKGGLRWFL